MKIIIDHNGVKREINGPFNVCGSCSDLLAFAAQLRGMDESASYGWVEIRTVAARAKSNQPVIGWDEAAP